MITYRGRHGERQAFSPAASERAKYYCARCNHGPAGCFRSVKSSAELVRPQAGDYNICEITPRAAKKDHLGDSVRDPPSPVFAMRRFFSASGKSGCKRNGS